MAAVSDPVGLGAPWGPARPEPPPTRFHPVHGANIRVDLSGTRATRVESFAHGVCFSREPLAPGQVFLVEIEEKELGWCGHLRLGLTALDPASLAAVPEFSLPDLVSLGHTWVFAITRHHNRVPREGRPEAEALAPSRPPALLVEPYLCIEQFRIPRDRLVGRSRPGLYSHLLDQLYELNVLPPTARRSRLGVLFCPRPDGTADMHIVINGEDMGPSARGLPAAQPLYAVVDVFASTKSVRLIQLEYGCKNTGVGCHAFLQGILLTQGWNLQLLQFLCWQVDSLPLNRLGIHTSEFTFYGFSRREPSLCQCRRCRPCAAW